MNERRLSFLRINEAIDRPRIQHATGDCVADQRAENNRQLKRLVEEAANSSYHLLLHAIVSSASLNNGALFGDNGISGTQKYIIGLFKNRQVCYYFSIRPI